MASKMSLRSSVGWRSSGSKTSVSALVWSALAYRGQDLSNKLGVDVLAPTNTVWIHPSGTITVGPPPYANSGSFDIFSPGGS